MIPNVLTIAGSDPSGGAGIQADLKTFSALGVYGASIVTAVTAQSTQGVSAIHDVPPHVIAAQIDAEVRLIIENAFDRAKEALTSHREVLDNLAALLVEKETIESDEFEALFAGHPPRTGDSPTMRRLRDAVQEDQPGADVVADDGDAVKPRRRGPAPQPA